MKKYEVILTDQTIGIYTGRRKPQEGEKVKVYIGNGQFITGIVYDVIPNYLR